MGCQNSSTKQVEYCQITVPEQFPENSLSKEGPTDKSLPLCKQISKENLEAFMNRQREVKLRKQGRKMTILRSELLQPFPPSKKISKELANLSFSIDNFEQRQINDRDSAKEISPVSAGANFD